MRVLLVLLGAALVILIAEWQFSFYKPCPEDRNSSEETYEEYKKCRAFSGPFAIIARASGRGLIEFSERNDTAITALSTLVIALFTATLFFATWGLLRAANSQSRENRKIIDAAEKSSRASLDSAEAGKIIAETARVNFLSTHRPMIRVKHVYITSEIWGGKPIEIKLVIVNIGITPAIIRVMNLDTAIIPAHKRLPPRPSFTNPDKTISIEMVDSGITLALPKMTQRDLSDVEHSALISGATQLYCYGFVEYADAAGRIRKTAFCRVWEPPQGPGAFSEPGRFVNVDDPDYEYQD